ncbi:MAG: CARDB domain-containing protein [Candidatus Nanoarchaeia archaeon]|nr:CARDB domain-containing protein [Candidatus Nanoarchaeia archaeon]MDD5740751.1 CARDB domain-containing protein [Candidatus Nanoarchaeia archaeon]
MRHIKSQGGVILNIILFLLLIMILLIGGYFLYMNLPGKPQVLDVVTSSNQLEVSNLSYEVEQFYPNMKFNHNYISYSIGSDCSEEEKNNMIEAFNELQNKVGVISFSPKASEPDIEVSCSESIKNSIEKEYFIAGEGGAKEIIQTGRYNVITQGVILLYGEKKGVKCDWPNVELHELLHVFGFAHSSDKNSLMYPYLESCDQKLDESIINNIRELYSKENLADLYFENATGVKKGRYFDFNVTVRNLGTLDAESVYLSVFDDNDKMGNFNLKDIAFGAGVTYSVQNLKLNSRSSSDIKLVIDSEDLIKEIDKNNNFVEFKFE